MATVDPLNPRDDLAALRARIELRVDAAVVGLAEANEVLAELRRELAVLPKPGVQPHWSILTTQEQVVLDLLSQSLGTQEIAARLVIAPTTARNHVQSIMTKLMVHTRLDAVLTAQEKGLI